MSSKSVGLAFTKVLVTLEERVLTNRAVPSRGLVLGRIHMWGPVSHRHLWAKTGHRSGPDTGYTPRDIWSLVPHDKSQGLVHINRGSLILIILYIHKCMHTLIYLVVYFFTYLFLFLYLVPFFSEGCLRCCWQTRRLMIPLEGCLFCWCLETS